MMMIIIIIIICLCVCVCVCVEMCACINDGICLTIFVFRCQVVTVVVGG